jgi:xanthine dehydrogenase YagS FAD-binding subunit
MKSFEYSAPASLREAIALLEDTWGKTEILAGGTDLITSLKQQISTPERVVSLKNVSALKGINSENDLVRIGSMTTMAELASHQTVRKHFPSILTAIEGVGADQIISVGTVGGDLCQRPRCWFFRNGLGQFGQDAENLVREGDNRYHAIFDTGGPALFVSPSSLGPALVALGATVQIEGPNEKRRSVSAAEFFQKPKTPNDRETTLRPSEILASIEIPLRGLRNATYEVRHREGLDWPYVTATVAYRFDGDAAAESRIVLGHVAPTPWISRQASQAIDGARVNESVAAKCGEAAMHGVQPLSRNSYKLQLVKTAVKRAVLAAAKA